MSLDMTQAEKFLDVMLQDDEFDKYVVTSEVWGLRFREAWKASRRDENDAYPIAEGRPGRGKLFQDGSWFDAEVNTKTDIVVFTAWGYGENRFELSSLKTQSSPEPKCKCEMRDLMSGAHPKSCAWLKWKNKK